MHFYKFHGNGNDFVIIDNRNNGIELNSSHVQKLCDRRFGVGADGLMLLQKSVDYDFEMVYYNSDGNVGSMCGNGGRCIVAFAYSLGIVNSKMKFMAFDGVHEAEVVGELSKGNKWDIKLQLADVGNVDSNVGYYFLDTGSPHYVEFVDKVAEIDVVSEGRKTRYSEKFAPGGTNVNFVEKDDDRIFVRTYERGVEQETLSCGTGVTASAIAAFLETGNSNIRVHTTGGDFNVSFQHLKENEKDVFTNIWLHGPAALVFEGEFVS